MSAIDSAQAIRLRFGDLISLDDRRSGVLEGFEVSRVHGRLENLIVRVDAEMTLLVGAAVMTRATAESGAVSVLPQTAWPVVDDHLTRLVVGARIQTELANGVLRWIAIDDDRRIISAGWRTDECNGIRLDLDALFCHVDGDGFHGRYGWHN